MATITGLAVMSMGVSVIIAEMLEGHAAAINQAGSLRMQSYVMLGRALALDNHNGQAGRRALDEAIQDFEDRLYNPRLTGVLPKAPTRHLRAQYNDVADVWASRLRPELMDYARDEGISLISSIQARERLIEDIDAFVARIDVFVSLIEQGAESKIRMLRAIQAVSLFLTLGIVFFTMYFMKTDVVFPLNDLLGFAAEVRRGNFSRRALHTGNDELGRLGQAFNVMALDLSKLYANLEARVREQTAELRRSNRSLELLYHTSTRLGADPFSRQAYQDLLEEMQEVLGIEAGIVCLATPGRNEGQVQASTLAGDAALSPVCSAPNCSDCLEGKRIPLATDGANRGDSPNLLTIPLGERGARQGIITLRLGDHRRFEPWQRQLSEAVAQQVDMALSNARRSEEARRMALLEERTALARELHDSLAQALSYLKIQVTRLDASLSGGGDSSQTRSIIDELRQGLADAYRQLRELLSTFRIQIDGRGLAQALEDTVREFQDRTETAIHLNNRLHGCVLDPNEEIHVLQIVREALTNVIRHARAQNAAITLSCSQGNGVEVVVEDDGVGLIRATERRHHYGLSIMRERADSLEGQLDLGPAQDGGGTRVTLRFTPSSLH